MPETLDSYGRVTSRYYDLAYADLRAQADVAFYAGLARDAGGPVLELGAGTGRALLPIAALGIPCTGLDASQAMLTALRRKPCPATLRLVCARMQDFALGEDRFALIFAAFRVFQHLYTVEDQLACLACVRRHLAPGGCLAFDVFVPRLASLARDRSEEHEEARFRDGEDEVVRYARIEHEPARQLLHLRMRYVRSRAGAPVDEDAVAFDMRYFFRFELEHLLARAGFADVSIHGGFDRRPCDASASDFVVIAR